MLLKTLAYIALLVFSILFFSAIFIAKFYNEWPWNTKFENTFVYMMNAMIGNWSTADFEIDDYGYGPLILLYIFCLLTTIIMLNLFVAILSDIYGKL